MLFCVPVHFDLWLVFVVAINIGGCMRHTASVLCDKTKNLARKDHLVLTLQNPIMA